MIPTPTMPYHRVTTDPDIVIEASTLGLPPGIWPLTVGFSATAHPALDGKVFRRLFTATRNGDVAAVRYRADDGTKLDVVND